MANASTCYQTMLPTPLGFHLGIVIPLKSRQSSRDWSITCSCLSKTLKSVASQANQAFSFIVVGHDFPSCDPQLPAENFHAVKFPKPDLSHRTVAERQAEITRDKNAKILQGIRSLRRHQPTHWFALDADDLIARSMVEIISRLRPNSGALIESGLQVHAPTNRARRKRNFSRICGSSSVLSDQMISASDLDNACIPWCRYSHHQMREYFETEVKGNYSVVNEPLVAYLTMHGDNMSDDYHLTEWWYQSKELWKARLFGRQFDPSNFPEFVTAKSS